MKETDYKITETKMQSFEYIFEKADEDGKKDLVANFCKSNQLTEEFIRQFRGCITEESFSNSFKLKEELTEKYPELFNEEIFKEKFIPKEEEEDQNTNPLGSIFSMFSVEEDKEKANFSLNSIRLEMFVKYFKNTDFSESDIIYMIQNAEKSEFEDTATIGEFIGISNNIDNLILKRVDNDEVRTAIVLNAYMNENTITPSGFKYLSNEQKELIIGDSDIDPSLLIKSLAISKDLGWQSKLINKIANGEMELKRTTEDISKDFLLLASNLPEDLLIKLFVIKKSNPQLFTYSFMNTLLKIKSFSEQDLIQLKDEFIAVGLKLVLKEYASKHEYLALLASLS